MGEIKTVECIKNVVTDDTGEICFIADKKYRVDMGYYWVASNEQGEAHIIGPDSGFDDTFFEEHFIILDEIVVD